MAVLLWSFKQQISHMLGSIWQSFSQSSAIILQRVSWPPATSTTSAGYIIDRERVDESFKNVLISLFSLIREYESFLNRSACAFDLLSVAFEYKIIASSCKARTKVNV